VTPEEGLVSAFGISHLHCGPTTNRSGAHDYDPIASVRLGAECHRWNVAARSLGRFLPTAARFPKWPKPRPNVQFEVVSRTARAEAYTFA
jgi:hypothetical protein